jgi:hypothetical protein
MVTGSRLVLLATLALFLPGSRSEAQIQPGDPLRVSLRDDRGRPLDGELKLRPSVGQQRSLGRIPPTGDLAIMLACNVGDRLHVSPASGLYYAKSHECPIARPATVTFALTSKPVLAQLIENAEMLETRGDWATSAMAYNEYYARTRQLEIDETDLPLSADSARVRSLELFAKYLEVESAIYRDPLQADRGVASRELVDAIRKWQTMNGLGVTGMLDASIGAAAQLRLNELLYMKIPPG